MYFGIKKATLRSINSNFKIGSIQLIKIGQFDFYYWMRVKIVEKEKVCIDNLTETEFNELGYKNKAHYLSEPFNKKNKSNMRIRYKFEVVEVVEELFEGIL